MVELLAVINQVGVARAFDCSKKVVDISMMSKNEYLNLLYVCLNLIKLKLLGKIT